MSESPPADSVRWSLSPGLQGVYFSQTAGQHPGFKHCINSGTKMPENSCSTALCGIKLWRFFYISLGLSLVCFTLLQEFWILVIQTFETLKPESVAYTVIVVQRCVGRCIGRKSHEISEIIISFYWSAAPKYKMFSYRAAGSALCCITFALKASSVPYYPGYLWKTFFFLHPGLFCRMA